MRPLPVWKWGNTQNTLNFSVPTLSSPAGCCVIPLTQSTYLKRPYCAINVLHRGLSTFSTTYDQYIVLLMSAFQLCLTQVLSLIHRRGTSTERDTEPGMFLVFFKYSTAFLLMGTLFHLFPVEMRLLSL